jgi:hypothetical protein
MLLHSGIERGSVKLRDHLPPFLEDFPPPAFEDCPPPARFDVSAADVGLPLFIFSCACLLEGALIPLLLLVEGSFLAGIIISFRFVVN